MAKMAISEGKAATKPIPQRLRLHPARLLYLFVVTLLVGIIYSEAQALLTNPASALDPSQLRKTPFWQAALAYPVYFAVACVLAIGAALLGWRLDRRYSALQEEQRHVETVAVAEAVVQRAQMEANQADAGHPHAMDQLRTKWWRNETGEDCRVHVVVNQDTPVDHSAHDGDSHGLPSYRIGLPVYRIWCL